MSDNGDLTIGIRAQTDAATFAQAKAAVTELGGAFAKTAAEIERSAALDNASKSFVRMAVSEKNAATAAAELNTQLKALGATDKEIEKVVKAFDKEVAAIQRAEAAAAKKDAAIGKAFEKELALIQKAEEATAKKASHDVERADIASSPESGGGSKRGALTTFGANLRNLPSVQIPGLGIGTDAVANIARVAGALQDSGKTFTEGMKSAGLAIGFLKQATDAAKVAEVSRTAVEVAGTAATTAATGAETLETAAKVGLTGAATAATGAETAETAAKGGLIIATTGAALSAGALVVALAPFAIAGIAAAAAVAALTAAVRANAAANEQAKQGLQASIDAVNAVDQFVNSGATSSDAQAKIAQIELNLATAQKRNTEAIAAKEQAFADVAASKGGGVIGDQAARRADAEGLFDPLKKQIETTGASVRDLTAELPELQAALKGNEFAAADAKEAAKKKEAEDKKAEAKAEQEAEKRAREAEALADKISAANDKIADAARKYGEKLVDIETSNRQKIADIAQSNADKLRDNAQKAADNERNARVKQQQESAKAVLEAARGAQKARIEFEREAQKATNKFNQDELAALKDQDRKLEDLQRDAMDSREESLNNRDFLGAAKASENLKKAQDQAALEANRAAEDRKIAFDNAAAERAIEFTQEAQDRRLKQDQDAQDRKRDYANQKAERAQASADANRDARITNERALRNQEIANDRAILQAQTAYDREQVENAKHLEALLGQRRAFYADEMAAASGGSSNQLAAQAAANGGSTQAGAAASGSTSSVYAPIVHTPLSGAGSFPAGGFGGLRPITTNNTVTNRPQVNIYANTSKDVLDAVRDLGFIDA